jgi:MoaA/NifB/PqqE/SkfB family radical SAM enzyme
MANLGYIQVTRECNQRCRFCSNPPSGKQTDLPRLCAQADELIGRGCEGIILTGGEPTLLEPLPELVAHVTARGVPARIITNGQRLAEGPLLDRLLAAGLRHVHLSLYSHREAVQDHLTRHPGGAARTRRALARLGRRQAASADGVPAVDLNVVINHENADHLHRIAAFVADRLPFVRHVVWNNLDPSTERVQRFPETVPTLWELEVSLHRALRHLEAAGRTFRVERVPLCYLPGFEHVATETRKIVKDEPRLIHFLDDKALVCQHSRAAWQRGKAAACAACRLDPLCAGLDSLDVHYDSAALAPVFVDPAPIARRILGTR